MDESDFMESESKVGYLTFKQNDYIHFDCCMRVAQLLCFLLLPDRPLA